MKRDFILQAETRRSDAMPLIGLRDCIPLAPFLCHSKQNSELPKEWGQRNDGKIVEREIAGRCELCRDCGDAVRGRGRLISCCWLISAAVGFAVLCLIRSAPASDGTDSPTIARSADVLSAVARLKLQVGRAENEKQFVLAGREDWLFFVPEVRSLTVGPFWGAKALAVSRSAKPDYADPLPALLDFHEQLKARNIELLVVPVPGKAAIYPEQLAADFAKLPVDWRLDADHAAFIEVLRKSGLDVLDLTPTFRERRAADEGPLYCRTDSHWSGGGVTLAASVIGEHLRKRNWIKELKRGEFTREARTISFKGDLTTLPAAPTAPAESLTVRVVLDRATGKPIAPTTGSPILLMGDSHTLVFHDPTLHAEGAGLPDHLAYELGQPVDLLGVRGSGSTATRLTLLREKERLVGKRLIIWCFSTREFTESRDGWRKVPLPK